MSFPLINPSHQFFDSSGAPLVSGTIEFRDPTSNNLINSYPTADDADAQTNANANPLTLNARGEAANGLYLEDGVVYKIILKDSAGATVWTQDDVVCPVDLYFSRQTTEESNQSLTPTDVSYPPGDIRRYTLNADGSTDDAAELNKIFAANERVWFYDDTLTYAIESKLTIPAEVEVDFHGVTISRTTTDATSGAQIDVNGTIRNLTLSVPTAVTINRGISVKGNDAQAYNIRITSVDQQNNRGETNHAAFLVTGNDCEVIGVDVENFDNAFRFADCSDLRVSNLTADTYVRGFRFDTVTRFAADNLICHTLSANATQDPGHNGLQCADCTDGLLTSLNLRECGEHGIRLGSDTTGNNRLKFTGVQISRAGQCGFKCQPNAGIRNKDIMVTGLDVTDCHYGNAAGTNEDGVRIVRTDRITITGYSLDVRDNATSAYDGIYIEDSTRVYIPNPILKDVFMHSIEITDGAAATNLTNIAIPNAQCLGTASGQSGDNVRIDVATLSSNLRNIHITDGYFETPDGYCVNLDTTNAIIVQPVIITGHTRSPTTGEYNEVTPVDDLLLNVRLRGAETFETATGTFTCSTFISETRIDSNGGAVTATLPDGIYEGQRKAISMSDAASSSTLSVTSHETSDPEVFTFAQTTDYLVLEWSALQKFWWTVKNIGVTT